MIILLLSSLVSRSQVCNNLQPKYSQLNEWDQKYSSISFYCHQRSPCNELTLVCQYLKNITKFIFSQVLKRSSTIIIFYCHRAILGRKKWTAGKTKNFTIQAGELFDSKRKKHSWLRTISRWKREGIQSSGK